MRKSFDGLMAIIRDTYQLDPYANAVYLFCGKGQPEDQSSLLRQNRIYSDAEKTGWYRTLPVAKECFRSKASFQAGIPVAYGRPFHRPAKGDPGWWAEERFLTFVQNRDCINLHFCFLSKAMGTYPPSASCGFYICGSSRPRDGPDFLFVDNFPEKKPNSMTFAAFGLFSGKLSTVIMTKRKSGWFAAIFLFLYNKD